MPAFALGTKTRNPKGPEHRRETTAPDPHNVHKTLQQQQQQQQKAAKTKQQQQLEGTTTNRNNKCGI